MPSTVAEKNATKNILDGWMDGRTEVKQYTPPPPVEGGGIINIEFYYIDGGEITKFLSGMRT